MNRQAAIMMTVLWLFNYVGGVSAVLCIDAEGTISMETAFQNKCICKHNEESATDGFEFNTQTSSCKDILLSVTALAGLQKRFDVAPVVFAPAQHLQVSCIKSPLLEIFTYHLQPYFDPLGSIMLTI